MKPKPPSIPAKKLSQNMYTGRDVDTVGPALYNPNYDTVKSHAPIGDFQTSKDQRKLFEPTINIENTWLPDKLNPGPGQYEAVNETAKRQFNAQGNTSTFLSKVPNCKNAKEMLAQNPGPGHYTGVFGKTVGSNFNANDSTADESSFGQSTTANQFNSTTHRVDHWRNDVTHPFTKQTYHKNPGPG